MTEVKHGITDRKLIEVRIGVEHMQHSGHKWWQHTVYFVWRYPDGSQRIVDTGHSGFKDAKDLVEREIRLKDAPLCPAGDYTGVRIRAKGGADEEPFNCDAESLEEGEHWTACDLGIPGGTMGTIHGYDADDDEYHVRWDDGEKWGEHRPRCVWSEAHMWASLTRIIIGAEVVEGGKIPYEVKQ